MKQNQVIAELSEYMENNPADAEKVGKVIEYLDACCHLFERGILSHQKITNEKSSVLQNMSVGYVFFVGWADYTCLVGFSEYIKCLQDFKNCFSLKKTFLTTFFTSPGKIYTVC